MRQALHECQVGAGRVGLVGFERPSLAPIVEFVRAAGYSVVADICPPGGRFPEGKCSCDLIICRWEAKEQWTIALIRAVRRDPSLWSLPIIVVGEDTGESEVVSAYSSGADHFMLEPVCQAELVARVQALLRRAAPVRSETVLHIGDIEIDREAATVRRRGRLVALSSMNFKLLQLFARHPREALSREIIHGAIWGADIPINMRTIDVHVGRLRKALMSVGRSNPIKTRRGIGYRFDPS